MSLSPASPSLPDAADRRRAATVFDRNFVVTAGAGTGKTALLVERVLNQIGSGAAGLDGLALITFTEKAAAELRSRLAAGLDLLRQLARQDHPAAGLDERHDGVRSYLWLRGAAAVEPATIASRALTGLRDLDGASVSTIHAFCAEILRRYPREAGVDPDFRVDEGPAFELVFDREWDRFLAEELGPRAGRTAVWRRVLRWPGALGAIRDLGRRLSSFEFPGTALQPGAGGAAPAANVILEPEARAALDGVRAVLDRAGGFAPMMARFLPTAATVLEAFLAGGLEALQAAGGPMPLAEFVERTVPTAGKKITGATEEEVRSAARAAHDLVRSLARVDEEMVTALLDAARPLAARCREEMLRSGYVSFDALLRLARDLLAAHAGIRRSLAARYRTLLIDEFQDTDPLQYEILFFIAESGGRAAGDAYRADLEAGRLFIVGDPKQSIYRFRGADIEAYRRAVQRVEACGGVPCSLSASFRSPAAIVGPVNRLFENWIGAGADASLYEPSYDPIVSARAVGAPGGSRVEIWSIAATGNATARRNAEADAIAAWITAHAGGRDATGAPLLHRHIAILMRALTNAGLYARALRRAAVPFIVEGGKEFYERPEVGDLIAFLRAAASPHDGASVLAVMRSPLGAVTDSELARFVAAGGRLDHPAGGVDATARCAGVRRTFELLDRFRATMPGRSPDDIIRAALHETPLALLHASTYEGAQRLANLRKLSARAGNLARQGLSLDETLRAVEEEFQGERSEGESPLADETVDAVRILSVHKAKGLEYPVVVVPDLGRESKFREDPATSAAWSAHPGGGTLAIRLTDGTGNAAWVRHVAATRGHEKAEEKRVFYVACTRAAERLILVNSGRDRAAPWREALGALGYAPREGFPADGPLSNGAVRHRLITAPAAPRAAPVESLDPRWAQATASFERVSASARASAVSPMRWPAGSRDAEVAAGGGEGPHEAGAGRRPLRRDAARLAGSAVHAALEEWDFGEAGRLLPLALAAARRAVTSRPGPGGTDARLARAVETETTTIIEAFLRSPIPARLAALEVLGREVPVLYRDGDGVTWVGACDLVYRDGEGRVVAADYKTDRTTGDPRRSADAYRPQMRVYLEALRRALPGETVRAEIVFLRDGRIVPIDPGPATSPGRTARSAPAGRGRRPSRTG